MRRLAFLIACLVSVAPAALAQRLPGDALPLHYQLTLAPDLAADRFSGEEVIDINLPKPTSRLTLHAVGLTIDEATLIRNGVETPASVSLDPGPEWLILTLPGRVPAGVCRLRLKFRGVLGNAMAGFYISRANGRKYAITQLQATDARRVFPCFDEPALKASFTISAVLDAADTAISNGRVLADTAGPVEGKHTLRFTTTPKMSTYLVALAVGDFACLEGTSDGIPIRACATPDKKEQTRFALEAAENILRSIHGYLSFRYPFRKLDLVAIPDFAGDAMENTGAIFFREPAMLVDARSAEPEQLREIAATVAHEIAHQWFGNLVTFAWWDDLWLSEGLATWMESKPLMEWKPQWHADLRAQRQTSQAMIADASGNTRAMRTRLSSPPEIEAAFDAVAYEKSAAVVRMMEAYVGPEVFRNALNTYLRSRAYGVATSDDFAAILATASRLPADRILKSFLEQPGVPLVTVETTCPSEAETALSLSTRRFLDTEKTDAGPGTWIVPLEVRPLSAAGTVPTPTLLESPVQKLTLGGCAPVLANVGAVGYFRTAYSPEAVTRLATHATLLSPAERMRLVSDESALVRAGLHPVTAFQTLTEALAGEQEPDVLAEITGALSRLLDRAPASERAGLQSWLVRTFSPRLQGVLPEGDADARRSRKLLMELLAQAGAANKMEAELTATR